MTEPQFVFVYGLLMRGFTLHHAMAAGTFVGEATARGQLVSLGHYPGLVEGPGEVRGELYSFDDLPAALDVLDDLEEFDATNPEGSLYLREVSPVTQSDGTRVDAWLYVYNGSRDGAPIVKDGDWRAHAPPHS